MSSESLQQPLRAYDCMHALPHLFINVHVKFNEVTRHRQGNITQDNSFFQRKDKRAALGGIRTHDTLSMNSIQKLHSYHLPAIKYVLVLVHMNI